MENYSSYPSYPESGDSSPRSREIEFENPPWDDPNQPLPPSFKVKFMCSYAGKIQPRPHDNQLTYVGGETKILSVERAVKYSLFVSKLASLCDFDAVSFKYQLPGEDLDALISVTTDDDLEHMMHEYDRLYRASPKPARLRLFIFPSNLPAMTPNRSFGSDDVKSDKDRFVDALNSGPVQTNPAPPAAALQAGNADFLFGSEKGVPSPHQVKVKGPEIRPAAGLDDRMMMMGSDPIQKHIQDLQRLQLEEQQQQLYRQRGDDNLSPPYAGGDYYLPAKNPDKMTQMNVPAGPVNPHQGYWTEKQIPGGMMQPSSAGPDHPFYMIPASAASPFHPQMVRQMPGPTPQAYYAVQRMPPEAYRDPTVYNVMHSVAPTAQPGLPAQKVPAYPDGYGMVRPTANTGPVGMGMTTEPSYSQVAYDSGVGRPVYYAQGGVVAPPPAPQTQYQAAMAAPATVSPEIRPSVVPLNQDSGKVVPKPAQSSV
ncbi:hypothetical protein DM860_003153 [Cuscuta australis]|uniref:PB1 domain-containing protein n=1 Tax=Cuscuta australis TaxID=267555 RepID=A0A328D3G9_9ASTE|nr:hypothetical protein DM860_003153 [Cuscuta australis]